MVYRRIPRFRRYGSPPTPQNNQQINNYGDSKPKDIHEDLKNIPLPNENESPAPREVQEDIGNTDPIRTFIQQLHMDEIILIGLIFLLITERIDDDFLLIILVYLLVSGIIEENFHTAKKSRD